jgi:hypothetical protein
MYIFTRNFEKKPFLFKTQPHAWQNMFYIGTLSSQQVTSFLIGKLYIFIHFCSCIIPAACQNLS